MYSGLADLVSRLRVADGINDCLHVLIDSRELVGVRIVGFREERRSPAIARLPRPALWAQRMGWPRGFVQEWIRRNLGQVDPALGGRSVRPGQLMRWDIGTAGRGAMDAQGEATRAAALEFLREHGIERGFVAPVLRASGQVGYVSWLAPPPGRIEAGHPPERSMLLLAELFFEALDRIRPPDPASLLSEPERRCLSWAAYGCTDKEIAAEIGRSMDTVRFHMKRVLQKLGAANRTHAVAVAMQKGLIRLGSTPRARGARAGRSRLSSRSRGSAAVS